MEDNAKNHLRVIECTIKEACHAKDEYDLFRFVAAMSKREKELLRALLKERQHLLNSMLLCTSAEITRMSEVNERLYLLTQKLYAKIYEVYTSLLRSGYDPGFDDDIMIDGSLRFEADDLEDGHSILKLEEDEEYGSDFPWMISLISDLQHDNRTFYAAESIFRSYNPHHKPDMTAEQLGLINELDDGTSWDHECRLPGICLCHAAYNLMNNGNLYSYPDLLRMNEFWCEVTVTHQHITDSHGNRFSCIKRETQED